MPAGACSNTALQCVTNKAGTKAILFNTGLTWHGHARVEVTFTTAALLASWGAKPSMMTVSCNALPHPAQSLMPTLSQLAGWAALGRVS